MSQHLRVHVPSLTRGSRELAEQAVHYVSRVHRLGAGDRFIAFDPEARLECDATVTRAARGRLTCELGEPRSATLAGTLPVTLLQAPGKGDRLEDVIRAATALGVRAIHVVISERSQALSMDRRRERLRSVAIDAARQCGRGDLPELSGPSPLETVLAATAATLKVCLHPRAPEPFETQLVGWTAAVDVALLVGPEGGFSDSELHAIRTAGFVFSALGPLTLRTELAGIAALGCFAARLPGLPDT